MTDTAQAYRPSPRPRPAGATSRPEQAPHLTVVPPPVDPAILQPENLQSGESTPLDHVSAGQDLADHAQFGPVAGFGARIRAFATSSRTYWTPPQVFTDQPASLADLAAYARHAPWTAQDRGIVRSFGVWYYRGFGYPYTVVSRYREWFAQRPLRYAALVGGVKLAALTGPGHWVVHTVIYPAAQFAGHIFL